MCSRSRREAQPIKSFRVSYHVCKPRVSEKPTFKKKPKSKREMAHYINLICNIEQIEYSNSEQIYSVINFNLLTNAVKIPEPYS